MSVGDDGCSSRVQKDFYVWSIDIESGLAIEEAYCGREYVDVVTTLLDVETEALGISKTVKIGQESLEKINSLFVTSTQFSIDKEFELCAWSPLDGLPYRLHTRRELVLMTSGKKPLCSLIGSLPPNTSFNEIPEYLFDPHVHSGLLVKREYCEVNNSNLSTFQGLRVVLYALVEESWRLDAYIQVRLAAKKFGWDERLIYQEGSLLGYSEWENDTWIKFCRERR